MKLFGRSFFEPIVNEPIDDIAPAAETRGGGERFDEGSNFQVAGGYGAATKINWHRAVSRCETLSQQNGIFHRVLEVLTDHTHGNGISVDVTTTEEKLKTVTESVNKVITETFFGKVNRLDLRLHQMIYEEFLSGETCIPAFVNEHNGFVELGYVPARWIKSVTLNPQNVADPLSIKLQQGNYLFDQNPEKEKMDWLGDEEDRKVIRFDRDPYLRYTAGKKKGKQILDENNLPKRNPNHGMLGGDVFYFRTGNMIGQERGQGDGFPISDWAVILEQGIYDFLRRYDIQSSVTFDLLVKGATDKDIQEKWSRIKLPAGRIPFAHNEKVELRMLSPSVNMSELTNFIRELVVLIAGSAGIPEYMLGSGLNTNVATAREQAPALYAKFNLRRKMWEAQLSLIARFAVEQANKCGMLYATAPHPVTGVPTKTKVTLSVEDIDKIQIGINFLPFERTNANEVASGFAAVVDAVLNASSGSKPLISFETAREIAADQASTLGIKIDPLAEKKQIESEKALVGTTPTGNTASVEDLA